MKAINWSSRTMRNQQQFESSLIIRRLISLTKVNSGQLNLFLQMGLIISSTFSFPSAATNPGFANSPLL